LRSIKNVELEITIVFRGGATLAWEAALPPKQKVFPSLKKKKNLLQIFLKKNFSFDPPNYYYFFNLVLQSLKVGSAPNCVVEYK